MRGKLIVIEGSDCSGKETQAKKLFEKLTNHGVKVGTFWFPNYESPTGKIVGGPYLGKTDIGECWFKEGAINVDPKVACLYFAADRRYNLPVVQELLANNDVVILDRYYISNMGHQGGKAKTEAEREEIFKWIYDLEHGLLELPDPDKVFFLYMPYKHALELKKNRTEISDHHEASPEHLKNAEVSYLHLAKLFNYEIINCVEDNKIKSIEEINDELFNAILKHLNIKA
ncbi:MAG: thymidylate kinase [Bacilli bacterium]|nr:thymidylate kinase [Bacilli bacterium]